jgi:alkylation response protein AidB-like acyl-CoA dehydrogenase
MSSQVLAKSGLVSVAADVGSFASRYAVEADRERRLSPDVVETLVDAGFARHFVPASCGGAAGTFSDLIRALVVVGEGCASAAWCGLIYATSGRMAAYLPDDGRTEVWGDGPDTPIAAALVPSGTAERVTGGWRLTGEWRFMSGVDFSGWALLCAVAVADDGRPAPRFFAVPRHEYGVRDTWFNVGMRGTGSNTAVLDGVFVPDHRTVAHAAVLQGRRGDAEARCHNVPLLAVAPPLFAAPALGIARGALTAWSAFMGTKVDNGKPARQEPGIQLVLARAAAEIDAAQLLVERAGEVADFGDLANGNAARGARDASLAAELAVQAVDRLFGSGGSQVQTDANAVQRAWRDIHSATSHAALRPERSSGFFADHVWNRG